MESEQRHQNGGAGMGVWLGRGRGEMGCRVRLEAAGWRSVQCHAVLCRAIPCHAVPCRAVLCCTILWYSMLCHATLCSAIRTLSAAAERCGLISTSGTQAAGQIK